ncbi:hypothetical protein BWI97_07320 [Siphonobacter sp. BAB-5405]|uniref:hypothetical protein n=1 Tax=Siphonobacter sp. BAB-5405 TaxID=1864825 RepID=UPI000C806D5E|nr:hypothetical protein [Siphonobacter sp. BAB-5405]PMD97433.1 hypothetical protein BWI97_07320 [Siphonobacter sp. BAB-5405]
MSNRQEKPAFDATALKAEASLVAIVHFVDGNKRPFYSGDVRYRGKWQHGNSAYWLQYWKYRIEHEACDGWKGRVVEGAIFENHNGTRGKRIAQFVKGKGWIDIDNN